MEIFTVRFAADQDAGDGGFNATPTGTHVGGDVYSIVASFAAANTGIAYVSDSTATGTNGGQIAKFNGFAAGTSQIVFDPPMHFSDGLMVDVSASGNAGDLSVYWQQRATGRPYSG